MFMAARHSLSSFTVLSKGERILRETFDVVKSVCLCACLLNVVLLCMCECESECGTVRDFPAPMPTSRPQDLIKATY